MKFIPKSLLIFSGFVAVAAHANVAQSGAWSNASTWSEGVSPSTTSTTPYTNLVFDANDITLSVDSNQFVDRIQLGSTTQATISVASGSSLTLNGYVTSSEKYYVSANPAQTLLLTGAGTINMASASECAFSNGNIIVDVNLKYTGTGWNAMALWGSGTLTVKKTIDVRDRQFSLGSWQVNLLAGSSVICGHTISAKMNIEAGAKLTSKSGLRISNLTLNGEMTTSGARNYESTNGSEYYGVKLGGTTTIGAGATLISSNTDSAAHNFFGGTMSISAGKGKVEMKKDLYANDGLVLNLNSSGAIITGGATTQGASKINIMTYTRELVSGATYKDKFAKSTTTINLGADNDFGTFVFYDSSILNLNTNGHKTTIDKIELYEAGMTYKINLGELTDFCVKINNIANIEYEDEEGNLRTTYITFDSDGYSEKAYLIEDKQNGGYWLNSSAVVPEPATIAAILGALALALAIRRRK